HDPRVALQLGAGARAGQVGAAARLAEALAPHLFPGQQWREVARLLLLAAPRDDRGPGHAESDAADVVRRADPRGLFEVDALMGVRRAAAAVLLGPGQTDVAGVVQLLAPDPDLVEAGVDVFADRRQVHVGIRAARHLVRHHVLGDELAGCVEVRRGRQVLGQLAGDERGAPGLMRDLDGLPDVFVPADLDAAEG